MLKVLLLSIGLVLVFEGLIYFLFAGKMIKYLEQISKIEDVIPNKIA